MKGRGIIVDLDGTLVDTSGLQSYLTGENTDYNKFHELVQDAPPNQLMAEMIGVWRNRDFKVIIITARQQTYYQQTVDWLYHNNIIWDQLLMRRGGDQRPDYQVKEELLKRVEVEISRVYEDNPEVAKMYKRQGLNVTLIPGYPKKEIK